MIMDNKDSKNKEQELLKKKTAHRRIGIAKEEMKGRSITLEELNSIDVIDLFYCDK